MTVKMIGHAKLRDELYYLDVDLELNNGHLRAGFYYYF